MMNKTYSAVFLACLGLGLAGCNDSDDAQTITPPVVEEATPNNIELVHLASYESGIFGQSAAEIPAYDAASKRLFVVNAQKGMVDVLIFY